MLGRSAVPKFMYLRPVGGPEGTSNTEGNPNINSLVWPARLSPQQPLWILDPQTIYGTFSASNFGQTIPLTIQSGNSARMRKSPKKVSKWVPGASRPRGQKSQKRVQIELKTDFFETFWLDFNSFLTFSAPGAGRPRKPISRLFSDFFTFGLNCHSEW